MKPFATDVDHDLCDIVSGPERRKSQRQLLVYRVVKIEQEGTQRLARCRNLSDGGMKIDLPSQLRLNDEVVVEFSPSTIVPARVAWTSDAECGLAFDKAVDCAELISRSYDEKQQALVRPPRLAARFPVTVQFDGGSCSSVVEDISQQGMKVRNCDDFEPGLNVKVLLSQGAERDATVRWTSDNFAGLFLHNKLKIEEINELQSLTD